MLAGWGHTNTPSCYPTELAQWAEWGCGSSSVSRRASVGVPLPLPEAVPATGPANELQGSTALWSGSSASAQLSPQDRLASGSRRRVRSRPRYLPGTRITTVPWHVPQGFCVYFRGTLQFLPQALGTTPQTLSPDSSRRPLGP